MTEFEFVAGGLPDTDRLGRALADALPEGTTVALIGTLGAGKTRLVQALAGAWDIDPETVVSPTFVLCQQYSGRRDICHLDSYRVRDDDEFLELGVEELFESPAVTVVEWADRVAGCLPPDHLRIEIEVTGDWSRRFRISARGRLDPQVVRRIAEGLDEG